MQSSSHSYLCTTLRIWEYMNSKCNQSNNHIQFSIPCPCALEHCKSQYIIVQLWLCLTVSHIACWHLSALTSTRLITFVRAASMAHHAPSPRVDQWHTLTLGRTVCSELKSCWSNYFCVAPWLWLVLRIKMRRDGGINIAHTPRAPAVMQITFGRKRELKMRYYAKRG